MSNDFETEREKREWEAQERALHQERAGASPGTQEPAAVTGRVGLYRLLVRTLKQPRLAPLPGDFAARTAARIEAEWTAADVRVEMWLERSLVGLLALVGVGAVVSYNAESLHALAAALPQPTDLAPPSFAVWGLAIAACVALTWALERWQREERH